MKVRYREYAKAKDLGCLGTWCLLFGPERRLKRDALARMRAEAAGAEEPTWEALEGRSVLATDLVGRCQTGALFGGARVVAVHSAERIPGEEQEKLAKAVGPLPPDVSLVLVTDEPAERGRRRALRAVLQRAIEKDGLAIEFPMVSVAEAANWATEQAKARGKKIEPAAARKLAEQKVGADLGGVESEVEKLALFVGDTGTITGADVDAVTPRLLEEDIFRLLDAIRGRRAGRAVGILRGLLRDRREEPGRILGMLAASVRLIWQAKVLSERGWRPNKAVDEETASLLPQEGRKSAVARFAGRPWLASRTLKQASAFSWGQLRQAMGALLKCDLALKGVEGEATDDALALELLVVHLCGGAAGPARRDRRGGDRSA